jgi:hypothetical protein
MEGNFFKMNIKFKIKKIIFNFIHRFIMKDVYFCEMTKRYYADLLGVKIMFPDCSYEPNNKKNSTYKCGSIYLIFEALNHNKKLIDQGPPFKESFGIMVTLKPSEIIKESHDWAKKIYYDTLSGINSTPEKKYSVMTADGPRTINY